MIDIIGEPIDVQAVNAAPDLQETQPIRMEDGSLVDPDSGEIVGWDLPPVDSFDTTGSHLLEALKPGVRQAQVKQRALFVMERMARATARAGGLKAEMEALLAPIRRHYEGLIADEERRVAWLNKSEGPLLLEFAKDEVSKGKKKSVTTPWGTVGFKASSGAKVISDEAATAKYLAEHDITAPLRIHVDLAEFPKDHRLAAEILEVCKSGKVPGATVTVMKGSLPDNLPTDSGVQIALPPNDGFYIKIGAKAKEGE